MANGWRYRDGHARVVDLVATLPDDMAVPCTPAWNLLELLAHLTGAAADLAGENALLWSLPEWTAAHVASRVGRTRTELLAEWATAVDGVVERVDDPEAAQIRIERRRPPLRQEGAGRTRASHGRATLTLERVQRQGSWRLEPAVTVLLGADQRPAALQATALHELGHALGLWGHSDDGRDVLAPAPGPQPTLAPTARDRETLQWLYRQPTPFGQPEGPVPQETTRPGRGPRSKASRNTPSWTMTTLGPEGRSAAADTSNPITAHPAPKRAESSR